jgi:hypothetical protein
LKLIQLSITIFFFLKKKEKGFPLLSGLGQTFSNKNQIKQSDFGENPCALGG